MILDWEIKYNNEVTGDLKALGHNAQSRIKKYLDKLSKECNSPTDRGEPYRNHLSGFWKYRVGNYRIICIIEAGKITVLSIVMIAHRSKSYSDKNIDELFKRAIDLENKIKRSKGRNTLH